MSLEELERAVVRGSLFELDLRTHGDRPALLSGGLCLTYGQLAARIDERIESLGLVRRLVLLTPGNDVESVVTYLAALRGGHPLLVTSGHNQDHVRRLVSLYDPDVVVEGDRLDVVRDGSADDLHPDLALLLSTSGSTGASKLVRLSHRNVQSNAEAIADFLQLGPEDRAMTSLPLHYCYGLSVLHSHLVAGAGVVVTDRSVVDPCFWAELHRSEATNFAGVPQTFELLDRVGFETMDVPSLRFITQAGGRLAPDTVERYAQLGARKGWDLFVMYGQTEATAWMTYLPPDLAAAYPHTVGLPIPGGAIELRPCPEAEDPAVGELVYRGPNVMMGYASGPGDLAEDSTIVELHTGDLARRTTEGLYEIVGRRSRFAKLFGLRIDLAEVERRLARAGHGVVCASDDRSLFVATTDRGVVHDVTRIVGDATGLPARAVTVRELAEIPVLPNGKPDYAAVAAPATAEAPQRGRESVEDVFALVFDGRQFGDRDTFVSLGGDSFSYVEASIRLEGVLGQLPRDWHVTPIGELARRQARRRPVANVETNVVMRVIAIVLVVGSHMGVFLLRGGAHVLLAIAGYNFARFQLAGPDLHDRTRNAARTVARISVPTSLWIGIQMLLVGGYSLGALLLVNNYTGSSWRREGRWQYWFLEALVQMLVVLAVLFSVPAVRKLEQRRPFAFAACLLAPALLLRFEVVTFGDPYNSVFRPHTIAWVFLLGWAAQRATGVTARLVVSVAAVAAVRGFFGTVGQELTVILGILLLVWIPTIPIPRPLDRGVALLAAASMYVYLVHWQVWPVAMRTFIPQVVLAMTLLVGVAVWWGIDRATRRASVILRERPLTGAAAIA